MNKVKEIRIKKGISQKQLADLSGVSRQTISKIENNNNVVITNATMKKISIVLQSTVEEIFFSKNV